MSASTQTVLLGLIGWILDGAYTTASSTFREEVCSMTIDVKCVHNDWLMPLKAVYQTMGYEMARTRLIGV